MAGKVGCEDIIHRTGQGLVNIISLISFAVAVQVNTGDTRVEAMIALNVSHESLDSVLQALARQREAKWVASTTGRFDVLVLFEFNSTEELFQYVRSKLTRIEGIKDSETFVCLHVEKGKEILSIS